MRISTVCFAAAALTMSAVAPANEGQIPLFEPTTITESGHYIVTNDFEATSGPAIRVEALDVTIDLNGHTVQGNVVTAPTGQHHLWVKNGRIVGALLKVYSAGAPKPDSPGDLLYVRLSNIQGMSGGIVLDPCVSFEVRDSRIEGAINLNGNVGNVHAHIIDSALEGGVSVGGLSDSLIRGNMMTSFYATEGDGFPSHDNLVESNTVKFSLNLSTSGIEGGPRNVIRGNIAGSITVQSNDNHIVGNSIRNGTLTVSGSRNVIDGNAVQGPAFGLVLSGDDNVYRNNVLHNNAAGAVRDAGTGNVDAGGNVN